MQTNLKYFESYFEKVVPRPNALSVVQLVVSDLTGAHREEITRHIFCGATGKRQRFPQRTVPRCLAVVCEHEDSLRCQGEEHRGHRALLERHTDAVGEGEGRHHELGCTTVRRVLVPFNRRKEGCTVKIAASSQLCRWSRSSEASHAERRVHACESRAEPEVGPRFVTTGPMESVRERGDREEEEQSQCAHRAAMC